MRKLTVKRNSTFVASLMKVTVCIDDPTSTYTVGGVPCRVLGTLKNGEEKTFEIDNEAHRVYVIIDNLSKNACNDFYELPAGDTDVTLSGKNHFHPLAGNPFRFDNNTSAAALQNRSETSKKGILLGVLAAVVGFVAGFVIVSLIL